jgi:cell pole-organizing protein PopZ
MSHAQKAGESGMEDLLASIRKAIDDDFSVKLPAAGSAAITGSMRELRVRVDTAKPAGVPAEPETYADREHTNPLPRPADPPPPKRNGFAGILSGAAELPSYLSPKTSPSPSRAERPSPPVPIGLRRGYDGSEPEPIARKPLPPETARIEPVRPQVPQRGSDDYARPASFVPEPVPPPASHARLPRPPASEFPSHLDGGLLSAHSALGAEAAFNRLADAYLSRGNGQPPLEDIARDLLRPMLKQWLDDHLAPLVERLVRAEIERVARRGGR